LREIHVLLFVFAIALLNVALGMGVAIVSSHDWSSYLSRLKYVKLRLPKRPSTPVAQTSSPPVQTTVAVDRLVETVDPAAQARLSLPDGWHERLAQHQIDPITMLEAVLHFVRVEVETHRARWIAADQSLRGALHINSDAAAQTALEPLRSEMSTWLGWVRSFLPALKSLRPRLTEHEACLDHIEELLLDQVGRIEGLRDQHDGISEAGDKELAIRKFLREYATIFEIAHSLRDFVLDQLAIALHAAGRIDDIPAAWQRDPVSGFTNRLGLESLLAELLQQDPSRKRLVSGAFIEIDRLGKLNERLGVQQSDLVIRAFAKVVEGVIRCDRGDRVARVAGPTILVLLTDAGVAGGKSAAERIRQTVEAATFQSRREEFTLAANCAVCDFMCDDTVPDLLARLRAGIVEAKRGGRNRTAIDEGQGPVLFDAQPIQVRAQTIQVGQS
jgi:diguanylate cyclase (GGDEF)-like protein